MLQTMTRRSVLRLAAAGAGYFALPPALRAELGRVDFSFLQVTDTHLSTRPLINERQGYHVTAEESIRRGRAAVASINECTLPHEFVVHTGDLAHTRDDGEDFRLAEEILQFKRPSYFVPGNHDVGYSEAHKYRPVFEKRFGKVNHAFEPAPGLRFVLFDSQPLDPRGPEARREQAFAELDRLLTPAKPTILCCHVTGIDPFYINRMHEGWPESVMGPWTSRLKAGGVIAVLGGHEHRDEHYIVGGVPFHIAGPVINFWGRQTGYRVWRLQPGGLSYRSIYLEL